MTHSYLDQSNWSIIKQLIKHNERRIIELCAGLCVGSLILIYLFGLGRPVQALRVSNAPSNLSTYSVSGEPSDVQPAMGYKVLNDTFNPQQ